MKLVIYQPRAYYYTGGAEVIALEHAKRLSRLGHEIELLSFTPPTLAPTEQYDASYGFGIKLTSLHVPQRMRMLYSQEPGNSWRRWDEESMQLARIALPYLAAKNDIDAVVSHNLFDSLAVPEGICSIVHLHGYPLQYEYHHSLLAVLPNHYVSVSRQVAYQWDRLSSGIIKSDAVVENGIDTDYFDIDRETQRDIDILYLGRLIGVKGVDCLLRAAEGLKIEFRVVIAGDGPELKNLQMLAKDLGVDNKVEFVGYVTEKQKLDYLKRSRLAVLPSRSKEGVLTTALEAQACGCVVISTIGTSLEELIMDGKTGFLSPPDDPKALSGVIESILLDQKRQIQIGQLARENILSKWTWDEKIKELEGVYRTIISKKEKTH
ncbi:glycosyltransferase family 4 protein [bacterium]|nr:glycosyltransferase family 4 protein [bacterium]